MFNNLKAKLEAATSKSPSISEAWGKTGGGTAGNTVKPPLIANPSANFLDDDVEDSRPTGKTSTTILHNNRTQNSQQLDLLTGDNSDVDLSDLSSAPKSNIKPANAKRQDSDIPSNDKEYSVLQKKLAELESVIREVTPLDGLSDVSAFAGHLKGLILQKAASMDEIKRISQVSDELRQQVRVLQNELSKIKEIQVLEATTKEEMFNGLQKQLENKEEEIHRLRKQKTNGEVNSGSSNNADNMEETNKKLESKVKELGETVKQYGDRLSKIMEKAKTLHEENGKLKAELSRSNNSSPFQQTATSAPENVSDTRIKELEQEIIRLKQNAVAVTPSPQVETTGESVKELEKWKQRAKEASKELKDGLSRESELKNYIAQLESKLNQASTKSDEMDPEKLIAEIEVKYQQKISELSTAAENYRLKAEESANTLDDARSETEDLIMRLEQAEKSSLEKEDRLNSSINKQQSQILALESEKNELLETVKQTEIVLAELRQSIVGKESEIRAKEEKFASEITSLQDAVESANLKSDAAYRAEIEKKETMIKEARQIAAQQSENFAAQLAAISEKLSALEEEKGQALDALAKNDSILLSRNNTISSLENELQILKSEAETAIKSVQDKAIEQFGEEKLSFDRQINELQEHIKRVQEENVNSIKAKQEELDLVQRAFKDLEAEKATLEDSKKSIERQMEAFKESQSHNSSEAQQKISTLVVEIESLRLELAANNRELTSTKEEMLFKQNAAIESEENLSILNKELQSIRSAQDAEKKELESLQTQLESMKKKNSELESSLQENEETKGFLEQEKREILSRIEQLMASSAEEKQSLSDRVSALTLSLEKATSANQTMQKFQEEADKISQKFERTKLELEDTKKQLELEQENLSVSTSKTEELQRELRSSADHTASISKSLEQELESVKQTLEASRESHEAMKNDMEKSLETLNQQLAEKALKESQLSEQLLLLEKEKGEAISNEQLKMRADLEEVQGLLRDSLQEVADLKDKLGNETVAKEKLREESERKISELEAEIRRQLDQNSEQTQKLTIEIEQLKLRNKESQNDFDSKIASEIAQIEEKERATNVLKQKLTEEIEELKSALGDAERKLQTALEEKEAIKTSAADSSHLQQKLDEAKQNLKEKVEALSNVEQSLLEEKSKFEKATNLLRQMKGQIQKLQQDCMDAMKNSEESKQESEKIKENLVEAERGLLDAKSLLKEQGAVEAEKADALKAIAEFQNRINELMTEKNSLEQKLEDQGQEQGLYQGQVEVFVQKIKILEDELSTSKKLFEQRTDENSRLQSRANDLESQLKERFSEVKALSQELQSTRDSIRSERDILDQEKSEMSEKIATIENELKIALQSLNEKDRAVEESRRELDTFIIKNSDLEKTLLETLGKIKQAEMSSAELQDLKAESEKIRGHLLQVKKEKDRQSTEFLQQIEEYKVREKNLVVLNQTLRDEVRKYQLTDQKKQEEQSEDSVNFTYIRNVVLKFVSDVHMRPQLVPVLGAIFNFTPEERAKIASAIPNVPPAKNPRGSLDETISRSNTPAYPRK